VSTSSVQVRPVAVCPKCDGELRLLRASVAREKRAIDAGYKKVCTECEVVY
jgi:uncharacterized protein with PIN domain